MSDQKLRELERKWKETGSVEDEAAYLRERVRVGDLTQEQLDLAAYCRNADLADDSKWFIGLGFIGTPELRLRTVLSLAATVGNRLGIPPEDDSATALLLGRYGVGASAHAGDGGSSARVHKVRGLFWQAVREAVNGGNPIALIRVCLDLARACNQDLKELRALAADGLSWLWHEGPSPSGLREGS